MTGAAPSRRAARRIVRGLLRGRAIVVLTPLAEVAMRVDGVAPTLTSWVLARAARMLPDPPRRRTGMIDGRQAADRLTPRAQRVVERLTRLGAAAAARNNELN